MNAFERLKRLKIWVEIDCLDENLKESFNKIYNYINNESEDFIYEFVRRGEFSFIKPKMNYLGKTYLELFETHTRILQTQKLLEKYN